MGAPVDVRAVLGRHVALAEQVGCREQQAEAHALFDAIAELIEAAREATEEKLHDGASSRAACDRLIAALRAVGGA